MASTGVGSLPHLALELFQQSAGIKVVHVPYRGAAPAVTDILGGQVLGSFLDLPVAMPQSSDAEVNPTTPTRRRLRRPSRSASQPESGVAMAAATI